MLFPNNHLSFQELFSFVRKNLPSRILFLAVFFFIVSISSVFAQTNEGFEAGGKTAYAAANVTLGSGSWHLDDALTGNLAGGAKIGSYSARVRNSGKVRMNFNLSNAGTIDVFVPNQTGINNDWKNYRVSVDYVESMTGYDFFSNITDATENIIEAVTDNL